MKQILNALVIFFGKNTLRFFQWIPRVQLGLREKLKYEWEADLKFWLAGVFNWLDTKVPSFCHFLIKSIENLYLINVVTVDQWFHDVCPFVPICHDCNDDDLEDDIDQHVSHDVDV